MWVNVNYYKSVYHPIPTLPMEIENKSVSSPFNLVSRYILFFVKLKGKERPFLVGARRGATLQDYPQEHLAIIRDEKVTLFVKFEIILPLLCFFIGPSYK